MIRNSDRAFNFQQGAGARQIANGAVDRAAAKLDCSGPQHSTALRYPMFHHGKLNDKVSLDVLLLVRCSASMVNNQLPQGALHLGFDQMFGCRMGNYGR
jgi:hypothetical protein